LLDDAVRQRWNELLHAVDRTAGDRLRVLEKRLFGVFACLFDVVGATGAGTSPPVTGLDEQWNPGKERANDGTGGAAGRGDKGGTPRPVSRWSYETGRARMLPLRP